MLTSSAFLAMTVLAPFCFAADEPQQKFPFIGKINQDNVNIRAGNNQNFEILSKANAGDMVFVAEESYGWYKVRLPRSAHLYAAKDFIEKNDNGAISKAGSLNLRTRPNKESSIICQIKKGDSVTIVAEDVQDWYEILPPTGSYGWIKSDFVEFHSYDMTELEEKIKPPVEEKTKTEKKKPERLKWRFLWW